MTTPEEAGQPRRRRPSRQPQPEGTEEEAALDAYLHRVSADDPFRAAPVEQEKGGTAVVDRVAPSEVFSQLLNRRQMRERGLLAPEPTAEETAWRNELKGCK